LKPIPQGLLDVADALRQRGLQIAHGTGDQLQLIDNLLELWIHRAEPLAESCEVLVINLMRIQDLVSDTNMLADR